MKAEGRNEQAVKTCSDPGNQHTLANFTPTVRHEGGLGSVILNFQFTDEEIKSSSVWNSPNVTQLLNGRAGIQTQICLVSKLGSFHNR